MSASREQLRVLFVAAEVEPVAQAVGLADFAAALPRELYRIGHDVRVVTTRYAGRSVDGTTRAEVPTHFVEHERYFGREPRYGYADDAERFLYFSHAALALLDELDWQPDVIHCNDWHTAIVPHWMRTDSRVPAAARDAASVLTIHDLTQQGALDPADAPQLIDPAALAIGQGGVANLLTQGIASADLITTVSERYAQEITTPDFGEGLDALLTRRQNHLRGIPNGIDHEVYDPSDDPHIAEPYAAEALDGKAACKAALQLEVGFDLGPRRPLVAFIGRLVDEKGFDLLLEIVERLLAEIDLQLVILGTGDPAYEDRLRQLASRNRRQLAVYLTADPALARRIYAGADIVVVPSRSEPCGIVQLIAQRYGTVPVVHAAGGLADTVVDYQGTTGRGTGFVFKRTDAIALLIGLSRALEVYRHPDRWQGLRLQGMRQDHSWRSSAERYVDAYRYALQIRDAQRVAAR